VTSSFGWLDHSEQQRRQMLEIVNLFREKGTVDELGIGVIRDAFADLLFPGTSTLQTRARYLLFVPWIYQRLERERVPPAQFDQRSRAAQAELVSALRAGGESEGVIGIEAGASIMRPPSELYWNALRVFGIFRYGGTFGSYVSSLESSYRADRALLRADDGELLDVPEGAWHRSLPMPPPNLRTQTTFRLAPEEAEYLRERIVTQVPRSLMAAYMTDPREISRVSAPWRHPGRAALPADLAADLSQARTFSLVMHGAAILYNVMVADASVGAGLQRWAALPDRYRELLDRWTQDVVKAGPAVTRWETQGVWDILGRSRRAVSVRTRRFIDEWATIARDLPTNLASYEPARRLIHERERTVKRGLARLDSRRALENWGGASFLARLDYRWDNVRVILADIQEGLARPDGSADA